MCAHEFNGRKKIPYSRCTCVSSSKFRLLATLDRDFERLQLACAVRAYKPPDFTDFSSNRNASFDCAMDV